MVKISALPPMTSPDGDDEAPIVDDSTTSTKKFTLTLLKEWFQSLLGWVSTAMVADSAITAIKTGFGGNFSTDEVNTGFKWIDGKDIYKKTVNFGALPNSTTKNVAHGISSLATVIDLKGLAFDGTFYIPINYANPASLASSVGTVVTSTNIQVLTGANRSSASGYVTLWYTKT